MFYSRYLERHIYPVTQKGKALRYPVKIFGLDCTKHVLFSASELANDDGYIEGSFPFGDSSRIFARPCPMRPRHGFVDSRIINSWQELKALAVETMQADPDGEIALTEPLEATYNAILTPSSFTIGPGNDGATAGVDCLTFNFRPYNFEGKYNRPSYITDTPFFELVYEQFALWNELPKIVQLRDGPAVPQSIDNVVKETIVKRVVKAYGDLLKWEQITSDATEGTVCWHPEGSLSSHYSIHCITKGIPVIISHMPYEGEVLQPTSGSEEIQKIDWPQLHLGFQTACLDTKLDTQVAGRLMLTIFHCVKQPTSYMLGLAMGCGFRLTLTACAGEIRHTYNRKLKRNSVYLSTWKNVNLKRFKMKKFCDLFNDSSVWDRGFGGEKWACIAEHGLNLHNAIVEENDNVLMHFNSLINSQHNNSWAFDKFIEDKWYHESARGNPRLFISYSPCATELHRLHKEPTKKLYKWRKI